MNVFQSITLIMIVARIRHGAVRLSGEGTVMSLNRRLLLIHIKHNTYQTAWTVQNSKQRILDIGSWYAVFKHSGYTETLKEIARLVILY